MVGINVIQIQLKIISNNTRITNYLILSEPTTFSFNYWFNKKYIIDKKSGMKQLVHSNHLSFDEIMNIYIQIIIILNQMIKYKLSIADLSIDDFAIIDTTNKLKELIKQEYLYIFVIIIGLIHFKIEHIMYLI